MVSYTRTVPVSRKMICPILSFSHGPLTRRHRPTMLGTAAGGLSAAPGGVGPTEFPAGAAATGTGASFTRKNSGPVVSLPVHIAVASGPVSPVPVGWRPLPSNSAVRTYLATLSFPGSNPGSAGHM